MCIRISTIDNDIAGNVHLGTHNETGTFFIEIFTIQQSFIGHGVKIKNRMTHKTDHIGGTSDTYASLCRGDYA